MKKIPLFKAHKITNLKIIADTLCSGMLGEGDRVLELQQKLSKTFDHRQILPLNSCTSSIILALKLIGVKAGHEVISTPFTMIATNAAVASVGAKIIWCDIDTDTFCADMDSIIDLITPRTKAVVVTCVGGVVPRGLNAYPPDGPPLILDCSHSFMTYYENSHISHWGTFSCFSFQSIKHLTTGDGGALAINIAGENIEAGNNEYFSRAEKLKWFGVSRNYIYDRRLEMQMTSDIKEVGYKFHMNDIAASIGLTCFSRALYAAKKSEQNATYYQMRLANTRSIKTIVVPNNCKPSWWVYGFLSEDAYGVIKHLNQKGIAASQLWKRNDVYSCFSAFSRKIKGIDTVSKQAVFIPNGWWVSKKDREFIADSVLEYHMAG